MAVPVCKPGNSCALLISKLSSIHWAVRLNIFVWLTSELQISFMKLMSLTLPSNNFWICVATMSCKTGRETPKMMATWKAVAGLSVLYQLVKSLFLYYGKWLVKCNHLHVCLCVWLHFLSCLSACCIRLPTAAVSVLGCQLAPDIGFEVMDGSSSYEWSNWWCWRVWHGILFALIRRCKYYIL